jgi:hypothetical protein
MQLNVIISVDWEPDHGSWIWQGVDIDYGGILKGTPAFCSLLDELCIPCTWFIESSYEPKRDLPARLPDAVRQITARKQDEVGLHVHWRRHVSDHCVIYETSDSAWVSAQIEHGIARLQSVGARPRAFRSGALLHVPDLPQTLSERGFTVDSSTLWGKANRLDPDKQHVERELVSRRLFKTIHQLFAGLPQPYVTDGRTVEQGGNSGVVEFPIAYSLFDAKRPRRNAFGRYLVRRAFLAKRTQYLMLFFHIDELTRRSTGPDLKTEPDEAMLEHFKRHLKSLKNAGAQFVTCSEARKRWLEERLLETGERPVLEQVS